MLPFGAGGVAEMLERWGEGEEPTEISDVCDFPAPLAQGLWEDCGGAAGLKINEWTKKERDHEGLCDIYTVKMFQ